MNRFRIKTQVLPEHIDNLGHVNNVQYLHWVQTVAHEHWEELTRMITEPLGFWVVRSHNITFKNEAFEGETLSLETYVKKSRGVLSERIVEIYNAKQILLAKCNTQWCYLDANNQKPRLIPNSILELFK
ncbi:acyl-CoA thioesterase [Flavobacteriaceae bacterium]|nr:acyl-CoA thioesterase [Flavobacteriaceae bacterium]